MTDYARDVEWLGIDRVVELQQQVNDIESARMQAIVLQTYDTEHPHDPFPEDPRAPKVRVDLGRVDEFAGRRWTTREIDREARREDHRGARPPFVRREWSQPQRITDGLLAWMEAFPAAFAPFNPYYVKNHVNSPGTVRSWFRQMRAADFERQVALHHYRSPTYGGAKYRFLPEFEAEGIPCQWTLFDTLAVVDRETAAHYVGTVVTLERDGERCRINLRNGRCAREVPFGIAVYEGFSDRGTWTGTHKGLVADGEEAERWLRGEMPSRLIRVYPESEVRGDPASSGAGRAESQ